MECDAVGCVVQQKRTKPEKKNFFNQYSEKRNKLKNLIKKKSEKKKKKWIRTQNTENKIHKNKLINKKHTHQKNVNLGKK